MLAQSLRAMLWLATFVTGGAFAYLAVRDVGIPAAASPVELAIVDHAVRLANHQPLYLEPSASTSPALMPGFPFVLSLLVPLVGSPLLALRVISLLSTFVILVLLVVIVRAETKSTTLGVASGGLMLMGLGTLVGTPEAFRPEALMLVMVLAAYLVLRHVSGPAGALGAALLLSAACLTQHLAVWFVVAGFFYLLGDERKRLLAYALGVALLWAGSYFLLSDGLGPWFSFNAWEAPVRSLQFHPGRLLRYVGDLLIGHLGVLTLMTVLSFALPLRPWRGPDGMWMCLAVAALAAGVVTTQASGGSGAQTATVLALALIGPISMQRVTQHLASWPGSSRLGGQEVVLAALALQFIRFLSGVPFSTFSGGA